MVFSWAVVRLLTVEIAVRIEPAALESLGVGEADRRREALTERPGGDLDAVGVPVLGVTGGERAPRAERLEVLQLEAETADERDGIVPNVVFPTAIEEIEGQLFVFYGMADSKIGVARLDRA